jgi:hypothetical protein
MKAIFVFFILMICFVNIQAQNDDGRHDHHRKIEELKAVKLLEFLQLEEDAGLKLIARMKCHNREIGELYRQKDSLIWNTKDNFPSKKKDIINITDQILKIESQISERRIKYLNSLTDILSEKDILNYLIFEKEFRKELKELMKRKK